MKTSNGLIPVLSALMLLSLTSVAQATDQQKVHPEVRKALAWTLPVNSCKEPKAIGALVDVSNEGADSGPRSDVDSYTLDRFKRKERRWKKCVDKYKDGLQDDFERLRGSAQHGLTQPQADAILSNMKLIQSVLMTPNGLPVPADTEVAPDSVTKVQ